MIPIEGVHGLGVGVAGKYNKRDNGGRLRMASVVSFYMQAYPYSHFQGSTMCRVYYTNRASVSL
jgi:hypothetical protein